MCPALVGYVVFWAFPKLGVFPCIIIFFSEITFASTKRRAFLGTVEISWKHLGARESLNRYSYVQNMCHHLSANIFPKAPIFVACARLALEIFGPNVRPRAGVVLRVVSRRMLVMLVRMFLKTTKRTGKNI